MTNGEKFKQVFGFDAPITAKCSCALDNDCKRNCSDIATCETWLEAEYEDTSKEWWINGKLTTLTPADAKLKLIEAKGELERYSSCHKKLTEAINIGIEAIDRVLKRQEK